ncbi:phage tail tape measure protein [Bacillus sp. Bva_UNVM-123]|uniref:phage tail tape measure protein n=1 Tax=Bacillus sp. Bva_UNVM-123 TaxID=2829798 RepID=UPI00391F1781
MAGNNGTMTVSLSLDASSFTGSLAQVERNLRAMGTELRAIEARGIEYGNSLAGLGERQDVLSRSLEAVNIKLTENRRIYDDMVASGTASEAQLERQASRVNAAQIEFNQLETELNEVNDALILQSSSWHQFFERLDPVGSKLSLIGDSMKSFGKNLSMKITFPLVELGTAAFKAAEDFESAFDGVKKTVDATEGEFKVLSSGIREMSKEIPVAATEIAGVAEAAGQLGIKKESILGFTRTMVELGVATNMSSDEAAASLVHLGNITQLNQNDFDRLGSSIVELSNNFVTTEQEIVDMALRLAEASAQVGLSEADILALATALSSVGIEAEMGGSAISSIMEQMQVASSTGFTKVQELLNSTGMSLKDLQMVASQSGKDFGHLAEDLGMTKNELTNLINAGIDLENFAKIAGMTGDQFRKAFEQDAMGALAVLFEGLANAEEAGDSAINMLQEMGISELRLREGLIQAGGASKLFAEAVSLSNNAWEENVALSNVAEERYKTTASQMTTLWNKVKDLGISIGNILIPIVTDLISNIEPVIKKFADMDTSTLKTILSIGGMVAAIGPLIVIGGSLVSSIGSIFTAVSTISGAIAVVTTGVTAATPAVGALASVFTVLTGPVGLAAAGIAALTVGGIALYKHLQEEAIPAVDRFGDGVSESTRDALEGFFELSDGASQKLMEMQLTQQKVTEETKDSLVETYAQMNEQILTKMDERHNDEMDKLKSIFLNSSALTAEEEEKILRATEMRHQSEIAGQEYKEARLKEIYEKAYAEKRELTESEQIEINSLQQQMNEKAVQYLSENEVEAKAILERMKQTSSDMSARQAAEIVKNSNKQKEDAIKAANEEYVNKISIYEQMRDVTGELTEEQANKLIAEATKQRDVAVKHAEDTHQKVVTEAKKQAGEHIKTVDWETGEILTKWEVLKNSGIEIWDNFKKKVSEKWNETKDVMEKVWNATIKFFQEIDLAQIGKDIIQGLINGIASMADAVWEKVKDIAEGIGGSIKKVLKIASPSKLTFEIGKWTGEGLEQGLDSMISMINKTANKAAYAAVPDVPLFNRQNINGYGYMTSFDGNKSNRIENSITQNIVINSPKHLSPSETARKNKQAARELALEWGL